VILSSVYDCLMFVIGLNFGLLTQQSACMEMLFTR